MTTCNYWTGCDTGLIAVHSPVPNIIAHHTIIALIVVSTLVNIYSVKWASRVSNWLSFLKFLSLAFIVVLGVYHIIANREWLHCCTSCCFNHVYPPRMLLF